MRTTIRIDETLYRRVKARAGATGRTVGEVIEAALRRELQPQRPADVALRPLPTYGGSGVLPGVDLSDAATLRELMDEGTSTDALR